MTLDELLRDVQARKRRRWLSILASEPPGRATGRRPRAEAKERLLLRLDRARLDRLRSEEDPFVPPWRSD